MLHKYISGSGEVLEITAAVVTAAQNEGRIQKDEVLSTEHVTYWKKVTEE